MGAAAWKQTQAPGVIGSWHWEDVRTPRMLIAGAEGLLQESLQVPSAPEVPSTCLPEDAALDPVPFCRMG